jgi:hypothetical protein
MIKKCQFWGWKKTDGSWFFDVLFDRFWPKMSLYGFIEKQAPQKALCLGPDPPPWEIYKFYRILPFFIDFGVFNRAGKTVSKIGIYALPPLKREIYWFFINSRPNFVPYTILFDHYPLQNWLLFIYRSLVLFTLGEKPNSFSLFVGRTYVAWGIVPLGYQSTTNQ